MLFNLIQSSLREIVVILEIMEVFPRGLVVEILMKVVELLKIYNKIIVMLLVERMYISAEMIIIKGV